MEGLSGLASEDPATLVGSVGGTIDDVEEETAALQLAEAASSFDAAHDLLGSPVLRPLWFAPVIGRQLRSASALAAAATTTAGSAADAAEELSGVLTASTATGADRLAALQRGERVVSEFRASVGELDLGPTEALVPPLANARNRFSREYARLIETLEQTGVALRGVAAFLEGPNRYLVMAANNGEMRAGSGMILQVGPMDVADGAFFVGDFVATDQLVLDRPASALDADVAALWGDLSPARDWRNTNLSPRFDETARLTADMWEQSGRSKVDGVISVDVVAIAELLELTGPVTLLSGETISADMVLEDLLVGQYRTFGDDRAARRERLGQVAGAVLDALNERPISAQQLVGTLREMGDGRHILMWSSEPVQMEAWRALGTDGVPEQDTMLLSVLNRGGNKLDSYLAITSTVTTAEAGDLRHVSVEVVLTNQAPPDLPPYVAGPHPFTDMVEGEYKGIVALTVPAGSGNLEVTGGTPAAIGRDGPNRLAATEVRLRRGDSAKVRFDFDLPESTGPITVLPSARVVPTTWTMGSGSWTDAVAHELALDAPR